MLPDEVDEDLNEGPEHFSRTTGSSFELVPGETASRARKNIRRDMGSQVVEGSRQFLKALGEVDQVRIFYVYEINPCLNNNLRAETRRRAKSCERVALRQRSG